MGVYDDNGSTDKPIKPSGRLQVLEPKDFPYLHTGKSLVFTIARNGMVWGKRLDEQSSRGDVELEVFWPREDGCLIKTGDYNKSIPFGPMGALDNYLPSSQSQRDKIKSILSQKEVIQYELGTLMLRPFVNLDPDWRSEPRYHRRTDNCLLDFMHGEPCNIKVVDCSSSDKWLLSTNVSPWFFRYDDVSAKFKFYADRLRDTNPYSNLGMEELSVNSDSIRNIESEFDNGAAKIVKRHFASQISGQRFDMSGIKLRSNVKIKPSLRIMYGEYDLFEYFEIDDAVLVLEEETVSADFPKLFWTLGIAQNKHFREISRLVSNNPDLFAPIFSKTQRRVGGGCTGTL